MTKETIIQLTKDAKIINTFTSMTEASKNTGIDLSNISRASTAEGRIAGGFRWRKIKKYS